jgi:hypothetical protein
LAGVFPPEPLSSRCAPEMTVPRRRQKVTILFGCLRCPREELWRLCLRDQEVAYLAGLGWIRGKSLESKAVLLPGCS